MQSGSHRHEWEPLREPPTLEDNAAIFVMRCEYREVLSTAYSERHDEAFTEEGPQCDEVYSFRMEAKLIETPDGTEIDVEGNLDHSEVEFALDLIEGAWRRGDVEWVEMDPDEDDGEVIAEYQGYLVRYEA